MYHIEVLNIIKYKRENLKDIFLRRFYVWFSKNEIGNAVF